MKRYLIDIRGGANSDAADRFYVVRADIIVIAENEEQAEARGEALLVLLPTVGYVDSVAEMA